VWNVKSGWVRDCERLNKRVNYLYAELQLYADSGDDSKRLPQFMPQGFVISGTVLVACFQFHMLLGVSELKAAVMP
jgi:hypothetical protein